MRILWLLAALGCGDPAVGPWSEPTPLALDITGLDDPTLTADMLELYVNRDGTDIYVATRASTDAPFGATSLVAELASGTAEGTPEISSDGLTLYMTSLRAGTFDIWSSTRASRSDAWSPPQPVPELDSPAEDFSAAPSDDDRAIVFASNREASAEIYLATRRGREVPWDAPRDLVEVGGPAHDAGPMLSSDGLTLFFDSDRGGQNDLYEAHRASVDAEFDPPTPIDELDTDFNDDDPWISRDGRHMVFSSDRDGTRGLWETSR